MRIVLAEAASSILGKQLEVLIDRVPTVFLRMVIRTVEFLAFLMLFARIYFVVSGVVLLLFPAMALLASVLIWTTVRVGSYEVINVPITAQVSLVVVDVGLPSQVLPIVRVYTALLVVVLAPRAPCSFEVEYVEVGVFWLHLME